jgi:hypothetical protein
MHSLQETTHSLPETTHREVDLCQVIINSSVIHLDIVMVVHISVEMVLTTIITMGTGVIKTGTIVEITMVETCTCHQEFLQEL